MKNFEVRVDDVEVAVSRVLAAKAGMAAEQLSTCDPAKLRVMLVPAGRPFCLWGE
jgi:hypothetical protein